MATFGEVYGPAMEMRDPERARAYFETLVDRVLLWDEPPPDRESAAAIVRRDLIYYAGYYSNETVARVRELFGAPAVATPAVEKR